MLLLVGTLGGYGLAGINESRRDERALKREIRTGREARTELGTRKHHEFQLEILLELQDALRELVRSTVRIILSDRATLKTHGKTYLLPEDINLHAYDARINYIRLINRVTDDALRAELESMSHYAASVVGSLPETEPDDPKAEIVRLDRLESDLTLKHEEVTQQLGIQLRSELTYKWIDPATETQ